MAILSQAQDALQASGAALDYVVGNCTRWVAENLSWVGGGWGNAGDWLGSAQRAGLQISSTPLPGAVAVWGAGTVSPLGHVAVVQEVNPGGGLVVSEENWLGLGISDTRSLSPAEAAGVTGFILPPASALLSPGPGIPNAPGSAGGGLGLPNPLGDIGGGLRSVADAVAGIPAAATNAVLGGIQNATGAAAQDVQVWAKRNSIALFVALVVTLVLFSGYEQAQSSS